MTSIESILYTSKQSYSLKNAEEGARHGALSGDDSFYSSGDSAGSTSSPTSSITSSGSSDEGVFVRQKEAAPFVNSKSVKNLKNFHDSLAAGWKQLPAVDDDLPMDLSCHNRGGSRGAAKVAASPVDRNATKSERASPADATKRGVKSEPVENFEMYQARRVSPVQGKVSLKQSCQKEASPAPSEETRNSSPQAPSTNPFLATTFAYTPSMFTWPYLMPSVSATISGLPALAPALVGGKYMSPAVFLPSIDGKTTVPPPNVTVSRSHGLTSDIPASAASSFQMLANGGFHRPGLQSEISNRAPGRPQESASSSESSPLGFRPAQQHDPAILAEFARIFGAHAGQLHGNDASKKEPQNERRRKSAKPTRVGPPSPENLFEKPQSSRKSPSLFHDLPTMVASQNGGSVFINAGQSNSLKRKSPYEGLADFSMNPSSKKQRSDIGYGVPEKTTYTWHNETPKSTQIDEGSESARQPQPVNFKPCRIPCTVCGRTYATAGALAKHAKTHEDPDSNTKFNCKICKKECSTLGALRMHIRTHTLPCECHICGKAFSRTWLLQGHIRTHTGEKPYQCTVCSRAFADRSNLRAHMQTHETIKRYSCVNCEKTFSRISLLKRHQTHCSPQASLQQTQAVA